MKDNKNVVFALNSYTTQTPVNFSHYGKQEDIVFVEQGFLLFPDEARADNFLEICDSMNKNKKTSNYTKFSYVEVSDFLAGRVESQHNFYVGNQNSFINIVCIDDTQAVATHDERVFTTNYLTKEDDDSKTESKKNKM